MENKYCAMMEVANDKYTKLVESVCQIRNGVEVDFDSIFKLMHSIYKDEVDLIVKMSEIKKQMGENPKKDIQIISFMVR